MNATPHELADLVVRWGGVLRGPGCRITRLTSVDHPAANALAPVFDRRASRRLERAPALHAAVIASESMLPDKRVAESIWLHPDPASVWQQVVDACFPVDLPTPGVSPLANVSTLATVAGDACVCAFATVLDHAVVREGAVVGHGAMVSRHASIGVSAQILDGAWIGPGVVIGARAEVGQGSVIGGAGFGYRTGGAERVRHVGGVVIEDDVHVGALCTIDAGTLAPTRIGAGTRIDNQVHIAHNVVVGSGCWILAQVGVAGSTVLADNVTVAGQAGIAGHLNVGEGARIAAQAGVGRNVPANHDVAGSPAYDARAWRRDVIAARGAAKRRVSGVGREAE